LTADIGDRMTQSALARHLSVKRQAINDLVKRGIIMTDQDGKIDVTSAKDAMAKNLRADAKTVAAIMATPEPAPPPTAPPPSDALDSTSYHVARTLRESAEAKIAQLRLRQLTGNLVEASRVTKAVTTWAAMARAAFEKIPDKTAERLAAMTDAQECHALLTAEIDLVLADLAAGARALKFDGDNDGRG